MEIRRHVRQRGWISGRGRPVTDDWTGNGCVRGVPTGRVRMWPRDPRERGNGTGPNYRQWRRVVGGGVGRGRPREVGGCRGGRFERARSRRRPEISCGRGTRKGDPDRDSCPVRTRRKGQGTDGRLIDPLHERSPKAPFRRHPSSMGKVVGV